MSKLFIPCLESRKCLWKSKEDRLHLWCGSPWAAIDLPLGMDGWKRNHDRASGISLEIIPYDLYPFLLSDNACEACTPITISFVWEVLGITAASISKQRWGPWAVSPLPQMPGWILAVPSFACPWRGWAVAGRLRSLLLPWIWAQQLWWHQLHTISGQPKRGSQHLWHKPACCSCYLCPWVACTAFSVQIHIGSALIIAGNKQAWAQLKSYSIALSVTLHRSLNSWCSKADGQNTLDLGQIEIRRNRKHGISPLKQLTANLLWYIY